jgi:predicted 3-demethylubiquinone-9 3-methyltransferase (glyoxalase superfamily)
MHPIKPSIWFQGQAEEAMNFYTEIFPNSKIVHIERYAGDQGIPDEDTLRGKVLTGAFEINGQQFLCLDGGQVFDLNGGISFMVEFDTQEELDKVWGQLADGGKPIQCGWVTDKFGVTWQIAPIQLGKMMSDPSATPEQKKALMKTMIPMVKLELDKLEAAFNSAK